MKSDDKSRFWAFEVYNESAPNGWLKTLNDTFIPMAYIYHDADVNDDGTIKKPHYHFMLQYGNTTTLKNIAKILGNIPANGYIERVVAPIGYYQYLTHENRPEKHQYSKDEICYLNGFDFQSLTEWSTVEKMEIMKNVIILCNKAKIFEYSSLLEYLAETGDDDLFKFCMFNSILVDKYICSFRNRNKARGVKNGVLNK